jgi:hypothetical protein
MLILSSFMLIGLLGKSVSAIAMDTPTITLVRREPGRLVELRQHTFEQPDIANVTHRIHASNEFDAANADEWPKFDFPKGVAGTNDCLFSNHSKMYHPDICKYAAGLAPGARLPILVVEPDFLIKGDDEKSTHPKGCFAQECATPADGPKKMCYFWNDYEGTPANIPTEATPVCMRDFYAEGAATANDVRNGCPGGYQPIMDHDDCLAEGDLLGYAAGSPFRTGTTEHCVHDDYSNPTYDECSHAAKERHRDYPIGCYVAPADEGGEVHYNFEETGTDVPEHYRIPDGPNGMKGTPLCKVSTHTSWSSS